MMGKNLSSDEILDMLAAYALRVLSPLEADDIRRKVESMTSNEQDHLKDYEAVIGLLGHLVVPVTPPESLEAVIMNRISEDASKADAEKLFSFVGAEEGEWQQLFDGITMKVLSEDKQERTRTALLDIKAGSVMPRHLHNGREEVYCLEGYCTLNGQYIKQGDYLVAEAGSIHEEVVFEVDCRIIAVLPEIEVLD